MRYSVLDLQRKLFQAGYSPERKQLAERLNSLAAARRTGNPDQCGNVSRTALLTDEEYAVLDREIEDLLAAQPSVSQPSD